MYDLIFQVNIQRIHIQLDIFHNVLIPKHNKKYYFDMKICIYTSLIDRAVLENQKQKCFKSNANLYQRPIIENITGEGVGTYQREVFKNVIFV